MTAAKKTRSSRSSTADELADLRESIEELVHHVACLTQAVDELTDQVQGQSKVLRNGGFTPTPKLTSMPLDPTAADWQVNRRSAADLPENQEPSASAAAFQQDLFDTTDTKSG